MWCHHHTMTFTLKTISLISIILKPIRIIISLRLDHMGGEFWSKLGWWMESLLGCIICLNLDCISHCSGIQIFLQRQLFLMITCLVNLSRNIQGIDLLICLIRLHHLWIYASSFLISNSWSEFLRSCISR